MRYSSSALLTSSFVSAYDVKSYYLTPVLGLVSHVVDTTWVNIIRTLRFNDTNRYGYLRMMYRCFLYRLGLYTIQVPSYVGTVTLILIWY